MVKKILKETWDDQVISGVVLGLFLSAVLCSGLAVVSAVMDWLDPDARIYLAMSGVTLIILTPIAWAMFYFDPRIRELEKRKQELEQGK